MNSKIQNLPMNNMFDILNSKSKFGKLTKKQIILSSLLETEGYLQNGIEILKSLKDTAGQLLIHGRLKCFIVGFTVSAVSILKISRKLFERPESSFAYILTHRFSQDKLGMVFLKIHSRLGLNNNPTVLEF